jgi:hypothetical protein
MKPSLVLLLVSICSCSYHNLAPPCSSQFTYNATAGICKNCKGEIGFNAVNLATIRKSKNAECLYLSKVELLLLLGDSIRGEYNKLINYNFKGSVLDSCQLFFNYILGADLRGTDLTTLEYGYAIVKGRKDDFTKAPATGLVTINGDSITCTR